MPPLKITDVKIIATAPSNSNWTIVKVLTSEPGLYGLGAATHQEIPPGRAGVYRKTPEAVCYRQELRRDRRHLAICLRTGIFPLRAGRNNALSGIDGALWTSWASVLACRLSTPWWQSACGSAALTVTLLPLTQSELNDQVASLHREGLSGRARATGRARMVRLRCERRQDSAAVQALRPDGVAPSPVFDATRYVTTTINMFESDTREVWVRHWPRSMTCMSVPLPINPSNYAGLCNNTGRFTWKIRSRLRMSGGSRFSVRRPRRRWPWENCLPTATSGCPWWRTAGSTSSASTNPR